MRHSERRVLSLVELDEAAARRLRERARLDLRPWTETRELADPSELGGEIRTHGHDAVLVEADFVLSETFEAAPGLRFVGVCRGDYGHVDVEAATKAGVAVAHTPGRNAAAVAELTLGLILALLRRVPEAASYVASGRWDDPVEPYIGLRGIELGGQVAGVIGLGAIGRRTAGLLAPFGCRILATDPALDSSRIRALGCEPVELDRLIETATIVIVHCPPVESTMGLIDAKAIARMPAGARLIVTTGEGVVDEGSVAEALRAGHLAGAAFDIFDTHPIRPDHPLLAAPNTILLPHVGGATDGTVSRYSESIVDDYLRFLAGHQPRHLVNPEVWPHRR